MSATEVLAELAVNLRLDSSSFATGSAKAAQSAKKLESSFSGLPKGLSGVTSALGGLAGSFAGGIIAGGAVTLGSKLIELGKDAIEHASSLKVVSQQVAVTTTELQQYRFAAGQVGLEQDKLDLGLKRLSKSIGLAANNAGPGAKAFATMGINVRDSNGHLKTAAELMPEIAGALEKVPDPAAKAALEFQLFGRSGQDMAPLLNQGAKGITNLTAEADKAGTVLSPQLIERAHEIEVRFTRLKQVIETKVEAGLLTGIEGIANAIDRVEATTGGFDSKLKALQDRADAFDKRMGTPTQKEFADSIGIGANESIANFDKMLQDLQDRADAVDKRLGIPSRDAFIKGIEKDFNDDLAARAKWRDQVFADIEALGTEIPKKAAAIAADVVAAWNRVTTATSAMVTSVTSWLGPKLDPAWAALKQKAQAAGDWFHEMYDRVVGHSYVPDMVDGIAAEMKRLDAVLVAPAKAATDKAAQAFADLETRTRALLGDLFPDASQANDFAGKLDTLNQAVAQHVVTEEQYNAALARLFGDTGVHIANVDKAVQDASLSAEQFGAKVDGTLGPIKNWSDTAVSAADKVVGALEGLQGLVSQLFGSKAGGIFSGIVQAVQAIAPLFAKGSTPAHRAAGGPVVPGRTYMVGENGPEFLTVGRQGYVTPPRRAANDSARVLIVPSPYFGAVVDGRAAGVAAPMAGQAAMVGAAGGYSAVRRQASRTFP